MENEEVIEKLQNANIELLIFFIKLMMRISEKKLLE